MNIYFDISVIVFLVVLAVLSISVLLFIVLSSKSEGSLLNKDTDNVSWEEKIYPLFTKRNEVELLKKIGFDVDEYVKYCSVLNIKPEFKKIATRKILGLLLLLSSFPLFMFDSSVIIAVVLLLLGCYLYIYNTGKLKREATAKKNKLMRDLPRFVDLLQTALVVDIPIEEAILITAKFMTDTVLSDELIFTMADSQIGAKDWKLSLQHLAERYDLPAFSDFVMNLINGYDKGLNIYDVVLRQGRELRQLELLYAEANASKVNNKILIPMALFKLMPIIGLIAIPLMLQMTKTGF